MNNINKFHQSLMQDIVATQITSEDGDTQEQIFTRIAIEFLSESGETENAYIAYDSKTLKTKNPHKINAISIADNYETADLFITIFENSEVIKSITKAEIETAKERITNFFRKTVYCDYVNEIAESSPIFQYANTLANYKEVKENLARVNVLILTNGEYKGNALESITISGHKIYFYIIDINHLYKIHEDSKVSIELDFDNLEGESFSIPTLAVSDTNSEYNAYIAIMPGICIAKLYERHGAKLLEQNVRAFLQFSGKVNKGIRNTIKNEPQMFFAFNNGIAATADYIELDETERYIKKINNLQIVNGGQTTASLYYTYKKDKLDLSNINVQIKFSVIKKEEQFSEIVSQISRYSNTQNKVNDADFSANNPALIAFERVSRIVTTPISNTNNMATYWFFERARGQYKTLRNREGFTKKGQAIFDKKHPKKQVFSKVELAKYINSYKEIWEGKKLVISPNIVVRGNEKNYAKFINNNIPSNIKNINNVYYEDAIAKCILFKDAEKRYGTKSNSYNIGELRQVVVPYTISLLNLLTNDTLDLHKIWREQETSPSLSDAIYDLMKQVNSFIINNSPVTHYIEWAKKEECWEMVKNNSWNFCIDTINNDLIDIKNPPKRNIQSDNDEEIKTNENIIKSIPFALWKKIESWGRDSGYLSINEQTTASDLYYKIKNKRTINSTDITRGISIFDIVFKNNIELLYEADELSEIEELPTNLDTKNDSDEITMELIEKMVNFDKRKRVLPDWKYKVMVDVLEGRKELTDKMKYAFYNNLQTLKKRGL